MKYFVYAHSNRGMQLIPQPTTHLLFIQPAPQLPLQACKHLLQPIIAACYYTVIWWTMDGCILMC